MSENKKNTNKQTDGTLGLSAKISSARIMRFDELLQQVGEFGLYQKYVFALICLPNMLVGFFLLNPVILLATPLHR